MDRYMHIYFPKSIDTCTYTFPNGYIHVHILSQMDRYMYIYFPKSIDTCTYTFHIRAHRYSIVLAKLVHMCAYMHAASGRKWVPF